MRVQYTLVVTTEAADGVEGAMRLKGLLKVALRRFGMRCVSVGETRLAAAVVRREAVRRDEGRRTVGRGGSGKGCEVGLFG